MTLFRPRDQTGMPMANLSSLHVLSQNGHTVSRDGLWPRPFHSDFPYSHVQNNAERAATPPVQVSISSKGLTILTYVLRLGRSLVCSRQTTCLGSGPPASRIPLARRRCLLLPLPSSVHPSLRNALLHAPPAVLEFSPPPRPTRFSPSSATSFSSLICDC